MFLREFVTSAYSVEFNALCYNACLVILNAVFTILYMRSRILLAVNFKSVRLAVQVFHPVF